MWCRELIRSGASDSLPSADTAAREAGSTAVVQASTKAPDICGAGVNHDSGYGIVMAMPARTTLSR